MKKLFLTLILSFVHFTASADIPTEINVYASLPNGTSITESCRQAMVLYEKQYNARVTFFIRPGAEGITNAIEAYNAKGFNLICGGLTELAFSPARFTNNKYIFDDLTFVSVLVKGALSFYTSAASPYTDLTELLNNKKRINVGFHRIYMKNMAETAFANTEVNWIPYKSPGDSLTQVADGSLDLYISLGSFSELVKAGKLKTLGHLGGDRTIPGKDLTDQFPKIKNLPAMMGLLVFKSKISNEQIEEFNRRMSTLVKQDKDYAKAIAGYDLIPYSPSRDEAMRFVNNWRDLAGR